MRWLLLFLLWLPLKAELVDPLLWEQLVERADFVGVIECDTAGGIVAKYKVIDAWKGGTNGAILSFFTTPNEYGPRYPVVLCGFRALVAGSIVPANEKLARRPSMFTLPLWWRDLPADYRLTLFSDTAATAADLQNLPEFKSKVTKFLDATNQDRELTLLKKLSGKYLLRLEQEIAAFPERIDPKLTELQQAVTKATNLAQIVTNLVAYPDPAKQTKLETVENILKQGGRAETISLLENISSDRTAFGESRLRTLVAQLKNPPTPATSRNRAGRPPVEFTAEQEEALQSDPNSSEFSAALESASFYQPPQAQKVLHAWPAPESPLEEVLHYKAASLYCIQKKDKAHYTGLLDAQSPIIQTTAASYLSKIDFSAAKSTLEKLANGEGPSALYAAFALAKKGDKPSMKKLLESIGNQLQPFTLEYLWQSQALVLLSNSAKTSHLPQPVSDLSSASSDHLGEWWTTYNSQLKLSDPWVPFLQKQGAD